MPDQVSLHAPLEVTADDVENALLAQSKEDASVAQALDRLRGVPAERAAVALNRALAVDIFDVLAQGWAQVPAMHRALELSALTRGPPTLVHVDRHTIASKSLVVLDANAPDLTLPPLELTLEILADVHGATLTARAGGIELVALGDASVTARLMYKNVLLKEHATGIARMPGDPFEKLPAARDRPASVDIPL